jgi:hypothetical glycosyl hydrolase
LRTALDFFELFKQETWALKVIHQTHWSDYLEQVRDVEKKIYLPVPNASGIIPQDDTYLSLPNLDLSKYKSTPQVGTIFQEYSLSQVNKLQVSKQADVLMLWHLFPEQFSNETLFKNFQYYESRTLHDSSLSLSTHAILANQINQEDLAVELFEKAFHIDLGPNMKSSDHGIHAASIGGIWQIIFFGFSGIRLIEDTLHLCPKLPKRIKHITIPLIISQKKYHINITQESIEIFNANDNQTKFFPYSKGETIDLKIRKL